jgi:hypothetical protein
MIINSLEQMESIVKNNRSLSWNGWDVVEIVKSNSAVYHNNGSYIDGSWYFKNVYSPDRSGWRIPKKYVR